MVEGSGDVEVVEEVGVLSHAVGIVLGHELELLLEFSAIHDLHLTLDLTDHVFEFVVDQGHAVTVFGVFNHLISD